MVSVNELLRNFFADKGLTQQEVAEKMRVSKTYINAILNGRKAIGRKQAEKMENLFGLSSAWLLTGTGEMLLTPDPDSKESEEREEQVPMGDAKQTKAAAREDDFLQIVKSQQETIASLQADLHRLIDKLLDDE